MVLCGGLFFVSDYRTWQWHDSDADVLVLWFFCFCETLTKMSSEILKQNKMNYIQFERVDISHP